MELISKREIQTLTNRKFEIIGDIRSATNFFLSNMKLIQYTPYPFNNDIGVLEFEGKYSDEDSEYANLYFLRLPRGYYNKVFMNYLEEPRSEIEEAIQKFISKKKEGIANVIALKIRSYLYVRIYSKKDVDPLLQYFNTASPAIDMIQKIGHFFPNLKNLDKSPAFVEWLNNQIKDNTNDLNFIRRVFRECGSFMMIA